mgnify:CR=1 FL=1
MQKGTEREIEEVEVHREKKKERSSNLGGSVPDEESPQSRRRSPHANLILTRTQEEHGGRVKMKMKMKKKQKKRCVMSKRRGSGHRQRGSHHGHWLLCGHLPRRGMESKRRSYALPWLPE